MYVHVCMHTYSTMAQDRYGNPLSLHSLNLFILFLRLYARYLRSSAIAEMKASGSFFLTMRVCVGKMEAGILIRLFTTYLLTHDSFNLVTSFLSFEILIGFARITKYHA